MAPFGAPFVQLGQTQVKLYKPVRTNKDNKDTDLQALLKKHVLLITLFAFLSME